MPGRYAFLDEKAQLFVVGAEVRKEARENRVLIRQDQPFSSRERRFGVTVQGILQTYGAIQSRCAHLPPWASRVPLRPTSVFGHFLTRRASSITSLSCKSRFSDLQVPIMGSWRRRAPFGARDAECGGSTGLSGDRKSVV